MIKKNLSTKRDKKAGVTFEDEATPKAGDDSPLKINT
jgi:hypothetical protein